jgi:hypothetical protein
MISRFHHFEKEAEQAIGNVYWLSLDLGLVSWLIIFENTHFSLSKSLGMKVKW